MKCESLLVHWDFEQISGCDEGIRLAQRFLVECGIAVCNLSVCETSDQRFDFLCKDNALVRHRVSWLECNQARTHLHGGALLAL